MPTVPWLRRCGRGARRPGGSHTGQGIGARSHRHHDCGQGRLSDHPRRLVSNVSPSRLTPLTPCALIRSDTSSAQESLLPSSAFPCLPLCLTSSAFSAATSPGIAPGANAGTYLHRVSDQHGDERCHRRVSSRLLFLR